VAGRLAAAFEVRRRTARERVQKLLPLASGSLVPVSADLRSRTATRLEGAGGRVRGEQRMVARVPHDRRRPALRLSEVVEPGVLNRGELYGDLLHVAGVEYEIAIGMRTGRGEAVVAGLGRTERGFSERDRDVLDIARPGLEGALLATQARGRLIRALADDPPPGTAVLLLDRDGEIELSSPEAGRWLAEHFGKADHPGWLPRPVAEWLALPPRPPLVSERDSQRLTVCLIPGDPHALLLEEAVAGLRADALDQLGLTARESEVLHAASVIEGEAELAWELFLSLHAVRERLARLQAKLGVRTAGDAVARALRESL
jgi:DNA-binding CsgD family transcriptional regulator